MAFGLPIIVALFAALSCTLLLPQPTLQGTLRVRRRGRLAGEELARWMERLGELEPVHDLLLWSRAERVARDSVAWFSRRLGTEVSVAGCAAGLCVLAGIAVLVATWWAASLAGGLVALGACVAWLFVRSSALARREERLLAEELPGLFRAVSGSLAAGQSLPQAIEYAARHGKGPAALAFGRVVARMRCGDSVDAALGHLGDELDAPGVDMLVSALRISRRTGSPLGSLLEEAAEMVEKQQEFERLLSVKTAQARLSSRIVCSMPVVMVGLLLLISPDFQKGASTLLGTLAILAAAMLDAVALFVIRRFMKGAV